MPQSSVMKSSPVSSRRVKSPMPISFCSDRYTDIGEGATYQSTWLDVAAWAN